MTVSKTAVFLRSCFIVFVIYMILSTLWNWMSGTDFWTPFEMLVSAVLTVAFFGGIAWLITNVGMGLLFGRKSEYRAYQDNGGDPFIDSLPRLFQSGESNWRFLCPVCGSAVQHRIDICRHCGYGADGDSAAYFARYGDVKPSEMTVAEWTDIKSRRHS